MLLGQVNIHMQKKNLDFDLILSTKINSNWFIDLNIKYKTAKLLEDNVVENLGVWEISLSFSFTLMLLLQCSSRLTPGVNFPHLKQFSDSSWVPYILIRF